MRDERQSEASQNERSANTELARTALFATVRSAEDRWALGAATSPARPVKANADLVGEGNATDQIHILLEGWAGRYKSTRGGSRQIIGLVLPGDVANLDSVSFGRPDFGVRMLTSGRTAMISRDAARALAETHVGIANAFTRLALIENAILSQWALCLGRKSAEQRLAHLLCELAIRIAGANSGKSVSFELPLTQEQLADVLGLTSVHVNRMLKQLRGGGLVEAANRRIGLPDVEKLRSVAEFDPAYLHLESWAADHQRIGNGRP